MVTPTELKDLLPKVMDVAHNAGELIQQNSDLRHEATTKSDGSVVTPADLHSEELIEKRLAILAPDVPFIGEETVSRGEAPAHEGTFWCVDPLDGTQNFVNGGTEYFVSIGLVVDHRPVLGVFYAPAQGWMAGAAGKNTAFYQESPNAELQMLEDIPPFQPGKPVRVAVSHREKKTDDADAYLADYDVAEKLYVNGMMKAIWLIRGEIDMTLRFCPICEWDTAAWQAVLESVGGEITTIAGAPLLYGSSNYMIPPFVAHGGRGNEANAVVTPY